MLPIYVMAYRPGISYHCNIYTTVWGVFVIFYHQYASTSSVKIPKYPNGADVPDLGPAK